MQQFRGLLIAVVVLAVLGAGAYWSNSTFKEDDGKKEGPGASEPVAPKILQVPDAEITQLEFRKKGQDTTVLKRTGNASWDMTSPRQLRADADAVIPIVNLLGSLGSESLVDEKVQEWTTYGLQDPMMELVITKKDGKTVTLQLGDELPAGGSMYARVGGESKLYTLASYNRNSLDKTWKDLRDKRLLTVDSEKLSRMELAPGKGAAFEFGKNQAGEWQIVKPNSYRADNFSVQELSQKLKDAKLDAQLSEDAAQKNAAAFGGAALVSVARLTDASGTQQLEIRKGMDKDTTVYYAKSSVVEGVHKIGADLGAAVEKSLDDYRSKKLFEFGFSDPTKVDLKIDGAAKSYGKNGDKWFLDGKEMKPETVQNLIDKLRDLSAAKFVPNPAKATPSIEITVNDGKKSETVRVSGVLAARGDEAYMYELAPAAIDDLKKAAAGIAIVEPPKANKDEGKKK